MTGLTHIQPITNDGALVALISVDNQGTIFYGRIEYNDTTGERDKVAWTVLRERAGAAWATCNGMPHPDNPALALPGAGGGHWRLIVVE